MRNLVEGQIVKMNDGSTVSFVCYSMVREDRFIGRYVTDKGIKNHSFGFIISNIVEVVEE